MNYKEYKQLPLEWNGVELAAKQLIGQEFGNLIVLGINPIRKNSQLQLDCYCKVHVDIGVFPVLIYTVKKIV